MIAPAFRSEWLKLRRRALLLGGAGSVIGFTVLVTVLGVARATSGPSFGGGHGFRVSVAELSQPDGIARGFTNASGLLGIAVLGIFAASLGGEYTNGTLRNLLVREPRRLRLLGGSFAALAVFAVILVALAALASALVALALAPSKGIDTSGWRSSEGLQAWWSALWHVTLASLGYGTAGAVLAIAFRSPVIALAAGVAWMLPGEAILTAAWSDGASWLPRQLLDALAKDGTASASFARAVALLAVYGAVAVAVAATLFARRDVTA